MYTNKDIIGKSVLLCTTEAKGTFYVLVTVHIGTILVNNQLGQIQL